MNISDVVWEDGWLKLKAYDVDARHFAYQFNQKKVPGEYKIEKVEKKRSLTANSYLWVLCDKIAAATNTTKVDVYREAVKAVGIYKVFHNLSVSEAETLKVVWGKMGIGWVTEQEDFSEDGDHVELHCYYGTSTYNPKQMCRIIDYVIDHAKNAEVETMPPEQLKSLLGEWNGNEGAVK